MQKDQPNATRIHHRNVGDYHGQTQLGHDEVVALCDWHHDGWQLESWTVDAMREVYGPSFTPEADFRGWTYDVLPGYGRGTAAWQRWRDVEVSLAVAVRGVFGVILMANFTKHILGATPW